MLYFITVFLSIFSLSNIALSAAIRQYQFSNEQLDVAIPSTDKDLDALQVSKPILPKLGVSLLFLRVP